MARRKKQQQEVPLIERTLLRDIVASRAKHMAEYERREALPKVEIVTRDEDGIHIEVVPCERLPTCEDGCGR